MEKGSFSVSSSHKKWQGPCPANYLPCPHQVLWALSWKMVLHSPEQLVLGRTGARARGPSCLGVKIEPPTQGQLWSWKPIPGQSPTPGPSPSTWSPRSSSGQSGSWHVWPRERMKDRRIFTLYSPYSFSARGLLLCHLFGVSYATIFFYPPVSCIFSVFVWLWDLKNKLKPLSIQVSS